MKVTEQTQQQIGRAIRKIAEKFPAREDATILTDIHIRVTQETGEIITIIRRCIEKQKAQVENMGIMKPYSFVLEDDDKESIGELYVVDDDTVIIDSELMANLDQDLDDFFDKLLKE